MCLLSFQKAGISNLRISGGSKYTPGGCGAEVQGVRLYQTGPGWKKRAWQTKSTYIDFEP
jgi:hypothetical protein